MQAFGAPDAASVRSAAVPRTDASSVPMGMPRPSMAAVPPRGGFESLFSRAADLSLRAPAGQSFQSGQLLQGSVVAHDGQQVTVSFGRFEMTGSTTLQLSPGQRLQVRVEGQSNGSWGFEVTRSEMRSPLTSGDLSSVLLDLRLPVSEASLAQARGLAEQGVPLTRDNLLDLQRVLAGLPQPATQHDLEAAVFLKAGSLPLTSANVAVLSSFMASHPLMGAQIASSQQLVRRVLQDAGGSFPRDLADELEKVPGLLGHIVADPSVRGRRALPASLQDMALQAGMGDLAHGSSEGQEDYVEWLRFLCDFLATHQHEAPELALLRTAFDDLAAVLQAQRLINASAAGEQASCYLQIPLAESLETAQARLVYHSDDVVPPQEQALDLLELVVPTQHLGDLCYRVTSDRGQVAVEVRVADEEAREHVICHLPDLVDNLRQIGYHVQRAVCYVQSDPQQGWLQAAAAPAAVERVDISA